MYIQHLDVVAHLDAKTKIAWHPFYLPAPLRKAFDVRTDIVALATQYGEVEEGEDFIGFYAVLKSGIFVMYEVSRQEVEAPFAFDNPSTPQSAEAWANDELVFSMQWNARGVFQVGRFEKGQWIGQLRRARARPDLHLI